MYRGIIAFTIITVLILNNLTYASSSQQNSDTINKLKAYVETILISDTNIQNFATELDLGYSEARYHLILSNLIDYMRRNNVSLDFQNVKPYDIQKIHANKSAFRKQVLELNLSAFGTALMLTEDYAVSTSDRINELNRYYGKSLPNKVILKYADGSRLEYKNSCSLSKENTAYPQNPQKKLNTVNQQSRDTKGLTKKIWHTGQFNEGYGTYNGSASVTLVAPTASTSLRIDTNTTWDANGVTANSVHVYTATTGTITVSNKLNYVNNYTNYAVATGDVVWQLSGSLGGSFGGVVSFSVTTGASWTEMLQKKYYNNGDYECITSVYT